MFTTAVRIVLDLLLLAAIVANIVVDQLLRKARADVQLATAKRVAAEVAAAAIKAHETRGLHEAFGAIELRLEGRPQKGSITIQHMPERDQPPPDSTTN